MRGSDGHARGAAATLARADSRLRDGVVSPGEEPGLARRTPEMTA
jgi:hypothetical protein